MTNGKKEGKFKSKFKNNCCSNQIITALLISKLYKRKIKNIRIIFPEGCTVFFVFIKEKNVDYLLQCNFLIYLSDVCIIFLSKSFISVLLLYNMTICMIPIVSPEVNCKLEISKIGARVVVPR